MFAIVCLVAGCDKMLSLQDIYVNNAWDLLKTHTTGDIIPIPNNTLFKPPPWYTSTPFLYNILEQAANNGVPSELALIPFMLSQFNNHSSRNTHNMGLWGISKSHCVSYGLVCNAQYDERLHPIASTQAVIKRIKALYADNKSWKMSFFLFCKEQKIPENLLCRDSIQFEQYLGMMKYFILHANTKETLPNIPPYPFFEILPIPPYTNIPSIARLSDIDDDLWIELNSFYLLGCTTTQYSSILVPRNSAPNIQLPKTKNQDQEFTYPLRKMQEHIIQAHLKASAHIPLLSSIHPLHYLSDTA